MHFYLYDCFKSVNDLRHGANYEKQFVVRPLIVDEKNSEENKKIIHCF
jgi:hypothetical protein